MRVTFLGTGTSLGVPAITCRCDVCTSDNPRNNRLRAGLLLDWQEDGEPVRVLVDTTTDLRQQALRVDLDRVDAVLYTHHHADHVLGLDELRIYNFVHRVTIPLYGRQETLEALQRVFSYAFQKTKSGVPRLALHRAEEPFELRGVRVVPVPIEHDDLTISAYRVGNFAYITDCSGIPPAAADMLAGVEVLVIGALRRTPHPAHFTLDEALAEIERLGAPTAYLTHLSHEFDHAALEDELPEGVRVAYDGLVLDIDEAA